ncbi:glycosyltransferase [Marivirga sp. S37H4]|uniref:Glycosyltransferase n=1 Tax=Marivirga aurantiaca TaxID=2802615 RepID=A0A934WVQ7_9BACT|nr:glycosyltransferase [Marivirga aurantiaca]MBK6263806.1 glycosyltransferase [Marivirga aurantiaca]
MSNTEPLDTQNHILTEIAWEVCNQVGGIYTVIRSKAPVMVKKWDENYFLMGPYVQKEASTDFEESDLDHPVMNEALAICRDKGLDIKSGHWLVSGRPQTLLFNHKAVMHELGNVKYYYWQNHSIDFKNHDPLMDEVLAFGYMVHIFLSELTRVALNHKVKPLAHFHEWMAGSAIPNLRRDQVPLQTVFTTHATLLGRYLAMNDPQFYDHLPFLDWHKEAVHFNIEANVKLERACVHGAHVFTTVSEVTGKECFHLLGRNPDLILPNGLNIERFSVLHEVQNLHHDFKQLLEQFVMGHFFQSYSFDLNKTMYFFTSGRFEFSNKGYDLTLEALARLNHRLKEANSSLTVVMFFITKQPVHSINPDVLNARAMLDKINHNCNAIVDQIKTRLYRQAAASKGDHKLPNLNEMVDDYWRLRHRRTIQSWKSGVLPAVVTHNLVNDESDPVLNFLRSSDLINKKEDNVKIVYHPDFISSTNPLFGMEYDDFVRACHLGIFPSYYEPWGYTPIECLARGVAAVTSDLSGFGDYLKNVPIADEAHGLFLVKRADKSFDEAAEDLTDIMWRFIQISSRERIDMRNKSEDLSEAFDWKNLYSAYEKSYKMALKTLF